MAESKAYGRLRGLRELGLVVHERGVPGPGVWLASRAGLDLVGSELALAGVSLASLRHDLALTDRAVELAGREDVARVFSERELRAEHTSGSKWAAVAVEGPGARTIRHMPDLVVELASGERWAGEVELTAKQVRRTRAILAGYGEVTGRRFDGQPRAYMGVIYWVPTSKAAQRLRALANKESLDPGRCQIVALDRSDSSSAKALETIELAGRERENDLLRRLEEAHDKLSEHRNAAQASHDEQAGRYDRLRAQSKTMEAWIQRLQQAGRSDRRQMLKDLEQIRRPADL